MKPPVIVHNAAGEPHWLPGPPRQGRGCVLHVVCTNGRALCGNGMKLPDGAAADQPIRTEARCGRCRERLRRYGSSLASQQAWLRGG